MTNPRSVRSARSVRFLFGLWLLLLAFSLQPSALFGQVYTWQNLSVTNDVPNNSTTTANLGSAIDVSRYGQVALDIGFKLTGAGSTACTFTFAYSVDATNYNTTAPISIALAPNGTTAVRTNLTLNTGALGYLKLTSITAANNSAAMTNIVVGYAFKPYRIDAQ